VTYQRSRFVCQANQRLEWPASEGCLQWLKGCLHHSSIMETEKWIWRWKPRIAWVYPNNNTGWGITRSFGTLLERKYDKIINWYWNREACTNMVDGTQVLTSFRGAQKGRPVPPQLKICMFCWMGAHHQHVCRFTSFIKLPTVPIVKGYQSHFTVFPVVCISCTMILRTALKNCGIQPTSNHHHLLSH